jgi:hypothetical protein
MEPSHYVLFKKNKCRKWEYVTMYLINDSNKCNVNNIECSKSSDKSSNRIDNISEWQSCVESNSDNLCYTSSSLRSLQHECDYKKKDNCENENDCSQSSYSMCSEIKCNKYDIKNEESDYDYENNCSQSSYSMCSEIKCDKYNIKNEESDCSVYENKKNEIEIE